MVDVWFLINNSANYPSTQIFTTTWEHSNMSNSTKHSANSSNPSTSRRTQRDNFTIIIDSREQTPWDFTNGPECERGTLSTGDYSIKGLEDFIAIERKELEDFIGCCGRQRDRLWAICQV